MARRLFIVTCVFLQLAHLSIQAQAWNCLEGHINIALIYDCRYNLEMQHNFFTKFLYSFRPFKWIKNQHKEDHKKYSFNLILVTYGSREMVMFEALSQKNFSQTKFNDSIMHTNTSSCKQHLFIQNMFNETRDVFSSVQKSQRKIAIFIFHQNITDEKSDNDVFHWLEREQSLNDDIKRLFILINPKVNLKEKGLYTITTKSLNVISDAVQLSIIKICNRCNSKHKPYKNNHKCYFDINVLKQMTKQDATAKCASHRYKSHLLYLKNYGEFQYVTSVLKKLFTPLIIKKERCLNGSFEHCKCRQVLDTIRNNTGFNKENNCVIEIDSRKLVKRSLTVFIGLRVRLKNNATEFMWDDGVPFLLNYNLLSYQSGWNCFYLSQSYDIDTSNGSVILKPIRFISYDCKIKLHTDILICESEMSDKKTKGIKKENLEKKKHPTYDQVLYRSFSLFLKSQIWYEANQNELISIMKQQINYTDIQIEHTQICATSEERFMTSFNNNGSFQNHVMRDKCTLNTTQFCSFYPLMCPLVREETIFSITSNSKQYNLKTFRSPNSTDSACFYEIDSYSNKMSLSNKFHLQNCEQLLCPEGFMKCPDSFCIPAYLLHDGTKDCPHGEDEEFVNSESALCQGKFKFTLKNLCLPLEFCEGNDYCLTYMNNFDCQRKCKRGYVCMSNIIRNDDGYNITYKVRILEATVELYKNVNSFDFTPQILFLFPLYNLVEIQLSKCMITNLGNVIENIDSAAVINLDVSRNDLSGQNNFYVLGKMKDLQKINISYNPILELDENFIFPSNTKELDLSYTKSGNVLIKYLVNLTQLKTLKMRHVEPIDLSKVSGKVTLDVLDLSGTEIIQLKSGYLSWLTIGKGLYTDDFRLCCDVIRGSKIQAEKCHATRDAISTCEDLVGDTLKIVILWVVGVLSFLGNIAVIIYRLAWDRTVFKTAYGLFVVCLGISDFIMGVYLLIVAGADLWYRNLYVLNDMYWRHSNMCQLAGILSTFSSETSTMFICLITLDRYLVIRYPFGQHRFSKSGKITSICLTLIIGVVVSVIPAVFPGWEIYSTNGMCLALPFSAGKHSGWEYSASLFVCLNFILFIIIAFGQLAIFRAMRNRSKHTSLKKDNFRRAQDFAVARQLFLVAMSDFCCWFPIGIMGIMSLNGYHFNPEVYAWSAVLILPVNSAINPLIYTFPIIVRKIRSNNVKSSVTIITS